jgi:uncharacterized protein with PIN domain
MLSILTSAFVACGGGEKKEAVQKKAVEKPGLNVETASKIEYEKIAILMDKYIDNFKDKKYEEVKNLYDQYEKDIEAVYQKYGTNREEFKKYRMYHMGEIQPYMQSKPELDYWKKYPTYIDALRVAHWLGEAKKKAEKK